MKPRELLKLFSLPRAPTRRIYHFGIERSLGYSKVGQNRKMKHKKKKCVVHSEGDNFQQVAFFFLFFYGAKKHRSSFRVRFLLVVQMLVILGCSL